MCTGGELHALWRCGSACVGYKLTGSANGLDGRSLAAHIPRRSVALFREADCRQIPCRDHSPRVLTWVRRGQAASSTDGIDSAFSGVIEVPPIARHSALDQSCNPFTFFYSGRKKRKHARARNHSAASEVRLAHRRQAQDTRRPLFVPYRVVNINFKERLLHNPGNFEIFLLT